MALCSRAILIAINTIDIPLYVKKQRDKHELTVNHVKKSKQADSNS